MTDVEVLRIRSAMSSILDRWGQFEEEFNKNSFGDKKLYHIEELNHKGYSTKDVLEELRRLAMGDWYDFHQQLLGQYQYSFEFADCVYNYNLRDFMKSFTDYMDNIDDYIIRKNFNAVEVDVSFFEDLMSSSIGTSNIPARKISEWLKIFEVESTDLRGILQYMPKEKGVGIMGLDLGGMYNEAKHKIDWNGFQKFERRFQVKFEDIQKEISLRIHSTLLELPWDKVKNSYV